MKKTTLGVFSNRSDANAAISELIASGINNSQISYITTNSKGETQTTTGKDVVGGAASGATTGAVIGGIAGLVVAAGILPGIGALFVAGPLAAALGLTGAAATTAAGALTGAAAGGIIGGLTALGVDKDRATVYESRIEKGDVLVAIDSPTSEVSAILTRHNAEEVEEYIAN